MRPIIAAALAVCVPLVLGAQSPESSIVPAAKPVKASTYESVVQGMSCKQKASGPMECEYKVGTSLRFIISGVGQQDVVITFHNVASDGDFLASVAPLHGCVLVQPRSDNSNTNLAFVSPADGKIHRTWNACIKQPLKK